MRPPVDQGPIRVLLEIVPELLPHYLDLVDIYEEDLTPETVFMELADVVTNLVASDGDPEVLDRCLEAAEEVATGWPEDHDLVGLCFLNLLPDWVLELIEANLGAQTTEIRARLDAGWPEVSGASGSEASR
ncbi:MAG: hypothetical protein ACRDZ6_05080 [Acidimicrobiales bacterium]